MKSSLALFALRLIPKKKQLAMLARAFNYLLNAKQLQNYHGKVVQVSIKDSKAAWVLEFNGSEFVPSTDNPDISIAVSFDDVLDFPSPDEIKSKIEDGSVEIIGNPQDERFVFQLLDSIDQVKVTQCIRHLRGLLGFKSQDIRSKPLAEINIRDIASQQDVDYIRDQAISSESHEPALAYKLMKLAHGARPQGPFIKQKLNLYRQRGYHKLNGQSSETELRVIPVVDQQLCYFPVPKTACSSVKLALYQLAYDRDYAEENYDGRHIHDFWIKRTQRIEQFEQSMILVRDPVERFLSAYASRVLDHYELNKPAIANNCAWLLKTLPHFRPDLNQFIRHLELYMLVPSIEHHCQPLSWLLNNDLSAFTHVITIRDINQAEALLEDATGKQVLIPKTHVGQNKVALSELTAQQLETLLEFYAEDYRLLAPWYSEQAIRDKWQATQAELAEARL